MSMLGWTASVRKTDVNLDQFSFPSSGAFKPSAVYSSGTEGAQQKSGRHYTK